MMTHGESLLTGILLLGQLAAWRRRVLEAAYPLVLHLQNASCDAGIVLVVLPPKNIMSGELVDYILHDLGGNLKDIQDIY